MKINPSLTESPEINNRKQFIPNPNKQKKQREKIQFLPRKKELFLLRESNSI
jgi:hypothetical protein